MANWDYTDYNEWEKRNPKNPFDKKPGEKTPPFNPNPPEIDIKPKEPKPPKDPGPGKVPFDPGGKAPFDPNPPDINKKPDENKNEARNQKIGKALGAAADIANSLKDPGLGVTFGSDPVRSGASHSRSGTAEGGPDYWRSHRNESGSPNDNDEY